MRDPVWVRRYVEASRADVHDWLERFGVKFTFILDTPEHSVPRFHFANGSALNVVVPMMRAAFDRPGITFLWETEAVSLRLEGDRVTGVNTRNLRSGQTAELRAAAVVIATGGWQANLDLVRKSWRKDLPPPEKLFVGAGYFAKGSGITLGQSAGAALVRMDHQVTFSTGLPDPRDPTGTRALLTQNPAAIWVNTAGKRFVSELASTKVADHTVLLMRPATHWLVFDKAGYRSLRVRDAVWINNPDGPAALAKIPAMKQADSIRGLAQVAGLPPDALEQTVARYNEMVAAGEDADFGRFSTAKPDKSATALSEPPFFAMQLFPVTRKSMGGLAIDADTRVLNTHGKPVPGLFAVGEATGVAGINGNYGGEGTFLGPSVYTGRIAGRTVARSAVAANKAPREPERGTAGSRAGAARHGSRLPRRRRSRSHRRRSQFSPARSALAIGTSRCSHRIVLQRGLDCVACHTPVWPTGPAETPAQRQVQLMACKTCH